MINYINNKASIEFNENKYNKKMNNYYFKLGVTQNIYV